MGTLSFIWGDLANSSNSAAGITAIICEAIIIISVINGIFICILKCMQNKSKKNSEENEIMRSILAEQAKQQAKLQDELRLYQRQLVNYLEKNASAKITVPKDGGGEEELTYIPYLQKQINELTNELNQATSEPRKSLVTFIQELCKRE